MAQAQAKTPTPPTKPDPKVLEEANKLLESGKPPESDSAAAAGDQGETETDPEQIFAAVADELSKEDSEEEPKAPVEGAEEGKGKVAESPEAKPAAAEKPKEEKPTEAEPSKAQVLEEAKKPEEGQPVAIDLDLFATLPAQPKEPAKAPEAPKPGTEPAAEVVAKTDQAPNMAQMREQAISQLEPVYALSEEDARNVITDPEKVIPKLFARMHVDMMMAVASGLEKQLPVYLQQQSGETNFRQSANREFWKTWPHLGKPEYLPTVQGILTQYRQLNPQADLPTIIREVGVLASVRLNAYPNKKGGAGDEIVTDKHKPAAPGSGTSLRGSAGQPTNPYEKLSQDWDEEEVQDQ